MRYFAHTKEDIRRMLNSIGARSIDDLFESIPESCRLKTSMDLPLPISEMTLNDYFDKLAALQQTKDVFIGAGSYHHFIPSVVDALVSRGEFLTAYTPYQPEVSQGSLQALFEYQTLSASLLGMDYSNSSMYDGATAMAEGILMSLRIKRQKRIYLSSLVNPLYRQVIETYLRPLNIEIIYLSYNQEGQTEYKDISQGGKAGCLVVQSPNFFGNLEDLAKAREAADRSESLLVCGFTEILSYGLLKPPGDYGADIVCGEGQSLGIPQAFGGPSLGVMTFKKEYLRKSPGRLVGQSLDAEGRRGFVITLASREQHIRRGKATSNICSNHSLCALRAVIYMGLMGSGGLKKLAMENVNKTEYLKKGLKEGGASIPFSCPGFNEFVVKYPKVDAAETALASHIVPGLKLEKYYPELKDHYLVCLTETATQESLDRFLEAVL